MRRHFGVSIKIKTRASLSLAVTDVEIVAGIVTSQ